jgi:hypothetical protein
MRVSGFNLSFPYGQLVTGGFNFAGKSATLTGTTNAGSITAASTTDVINGSTDVTNILLDGGAPGVAIKSISLTLDNTMRAIEGIGEAGPTNQAAGRSMVTGSIEAYFANATLYNKLLLNTSSTLEWTVGDGTNTLAFLMDNVKFNDGSPTVSGVDTDVMLTLNFTALFDTTTATNLQITRS